MNEALQLPGISNAWTMPVKARIDMLSTGIRTPVGLKISGDDLGEIERVGDECGDGCWRRVRGTRSVFAERTQSGYLPGFRLEPRAAGALRPDRGRGAGGRAERHRRRERHRHRARARALSGQRALHARFPQRPGRAAPRAGAGIGGQRQIPLGELADVKMVSGPAMLRDEDGLLTGYVYVDVAGRDVGGYVEEASRDRARQGEAPARLRHRLERPVRGHGTRAPSA